jgi:hypothetical protein
MMLRLLSLCTFPICMNLNQKKWCQYVLSMP